MEKHLLIIAENDLQCGDRMVTPKSGAGLIQHHVIYLGWIDYDYWIIENKDGIGVRLITMREFFKEGVIITRIEKFVPRENYSRYDLLQFSLSLIGKRYYLWQYNCEDFCNHVQHGKPESKQVKNVVIALVVILGLTLIFNSESID